MLKSSAMLDTFLVPENTRVTAKGDSPALDLSPADNPYFLLNLNITEIVEQESLDVSIWGSSDGANWGDKPLASFPQKFYRGRHPLLLDLSTETSVKFVRAHWEVNRWGRGSATPDFVFSLSLREVPAEVLKQVAAEAKSRR